MILVGNSGLAENALPFSNMVDYMVETNSMILNIKLRTAAKQDSCMAVYLKRGMEYQIPPDVEDKVTYFDTDEQLLSMLETGAKDKADKEDARQEAENQVPSFTVVGDEASDTETVTQEEQEQQQDFTAVDDVLPEGLIVIPELGVNVDALKMKLEMKDEIIAQKDASLQEAKEILEETYKVQEMQLREVHEAHAQLISEANSTIAKLKEKVESSQLPEELQAFVGFGRYASNPKAQLKEGFSQSEKDFLRAKGVNFTIFASASGDSYYTLMEQVKDIMRSGSDTLFVDFSNDCYLNVNFQSQPREYSLLLDDPNVDPSLLVKEVNGTRYIPTGAFNDISLLTMDWVSVLEKISALAKGRPVILLFNSLNSFAVRYTVSKLATVGALTVFANCNPLIITSLYLELKFIPADRVRVVVMNYINSMEEILRRYGEYLKIEACKSKIEWKKLGIQV